MATERLLVKMILLFLSIYSINLIYSLLHGKHVFPTTANFFSATEIVKKIELRCNKIWQIFAQIESNDNRHLFAVNCEHELLVHAPIKMHLGRMTDESPLPHQRCITPNIKNLQENRFQICCSFDWSQDMFSRSNWCINAQYMRKKNKNHIQIQIRNSSSN